VRERERERKRKRIIEIERGGGKGGRGREEGGGGEDRGSIKAVQLVRVICEYIYHRLTSEVWRLLLVSMKACMDMCI